MIASRSLPIVLTLALLLAQHAGQAHALSHLDTDVLKEGTSHTTLCGKCSSFGQLSSLVPATAPLPFDWPSSVERHIAVDCGSARRTTAAFQSRAPPFLA